MSIQQYNFPTTIKFGQGASKELGEHCQSLGISSPLVLTDQAVAKLPFMATIMDTLASSGAKPFLSAHTIGNPVGSHVEASLADYQANSCDGIIAVGGGAALDVGKAVAVVATNPGHIFDYDALSDNCKPMNQPLPPVIAVPTTAGTGSEVGRASVISDDKTKAKKIIFHPSLMPKMVVADPELTIGLPPQVTAATGFDALTHNIEAFLSQGYNPICDGIALEGIHLVNKSLATAVQEPGNIEARTNMLMASLMGAIAFQKGLGVTHSCAHALSTVYDLHHGLANALMLEACLNFNAATNGMQVCRLGQAVGLGQADKIGPKDFISWVATLREKVGIKKGLKHYGVTDIAPLLDVAVADFCHTENPRPVTREDFKRLYEDSL